MDDPATADTLSAALRETAMQLEAEVVRQKLRAQREAAGPVEYPLTSVPAYVPQPADPVYPNV